MAGKAAAGVVEVDPVVDVMARGVVALESIAGSLAFLRGYVESNGIPGSFYERAQRGLGKARTGLSVVRLWRVTREAVGPSERVALRDLAAGVLAGLALPLRVDPRAWALWVLDGVREADADAEDRRVAAAGAVEAGR